LATSSNGERYILGVIDYFTKFPMLIPIRNMEAKTVAAALIKRWITVFGAPHSIHSDRGTCFESEIFREMCSLLNIKKTKTSPYYPQSDGLIERLFRTVKDMIYGTTRTFHREWREVLPLVEMGLRSTIQSTTKVSPYELVFGRPMRLPTSWMFGAKDDAENSGRIGDRRFYSQYVLDLQERLRSVWERCRKKQPKETTTEEEKKKKAQLAVGSRVMARILPIEKSINNARFDGPYVISKKQGDWSYELVHVNTGKRIGRNHHHVKPCYSGCFEEEARWPPVNKKTPSTPNGRMSKIAHASTSKTGQASTSKVAHRSTSKVGPRRSRIHLPPQRYGFS